MTDHLNSSKRFKTKPKFAIRKVRIITVAGPDSSSTPLATATSAQTTWSKTHKFFAYTKNIASPVLHSFSGLKKNFFNFGLEFVLIGLGVCGLGFNLIASQSRFETSQNRFLSYLIQHPGLNENIMEKIQTEKIRVSPERERLISAAAAATVDPVITQNNIMLAQDMNHKLETQMSMLTYPDSVIMKPNFASKDVILRRDIREYTVQNGDSIAKIASNFGISTQTIVYENKLGENDYIRPGQVLKILPTTGIKHAVQSGETIDGIAKKYGVDAETILEFNEIEIPDDIYAGEVLIIPDAKVEITETRKSQIASLNRVDVKRAEVPENFAGSVGALIWPLPTRNVTQYYSSKHRALDISNGERPQFWSSQDGIVELSGWQAGYGRTVVINHGNGVKTRYAHASELYVSAGDAVVKGQLIGRVGNTGRTYGRTGNHLHFEIMKNGTKVNPKDYVK